MSLLFASITNDFSGPNTLASRVSGPFTFSTHDVYLVSEVVEESVQSRIVGNDVGCGGLKDFVDVDRMLLRPQRRVGSDGFICSIVLIGRCCMEIERLVDASVGRWA